MSSAIRRVVCHPECKIAESAFKNCTKFMVNQFGYRDMEEKIVQVGKILKMAEIRLKNKFILL